MPDVPSHLQYRAALWCLCSSRPNDPRFANRQKGRFCGPVGFRSFLSPDPHDPKKPRMAKSIVQTCQIVKEKHVYVKSDISMTCSLTHTMIYGTISRRSKKRSARTHRYESSSRNCASVPFIFSRGNSGSANTLPYTLSPGLKSRSLFPLKRNHSHRTHLLRPDQDPPPRRNLPPTAPTLLCHRCLPSLLLPVTRPQRLECFLLQHLPYLQ